MPDSDRLPPRQADLDDLRENTEVVRLLKRPLSVPPTPELCLGEISNSTGIDEVF